MSQSRHFAQVPGRRWCGLRSRGQASSSESSRAAGRAAVGHPVEIKGRGRWQTPAMRSFLKHSPDLVHLVIVAVVIVPLFALIARWGPEGNPDALAAAYPAWHFVNNGTLDHSEVAFIADDLERLDIWFLETSDGAVVSNRAPGLIGLATLGYLALGRPTFTAGPATAVALLTTVFAVLVMWRVMSRLVGRRFATAGALVLALGTTTWWVSATELWPHGPGQLWASLAVASVAAGSYAKAGWAFALAVVTRPVTAVMAAVTGLAESFRLKTVKPAVQVGIGSSVGLLLVVAYNRAVFGAWSVRGGYSESFSTGRYSFAEYLVNLWEMTVGLPNGVLTTSPILGVAVYGMYRARRTVPGWAFSILSAAVGYLALHAALNYASGDSVVFYRYPLEAIMLATPALVIGAKWMWDEGGVWRGLVVSAAVASITLQVAHVLLWSCVITDPVIPACVLD